MRKRTTRTGLSRRAKSEIPALRAPVGPGGRPLEPDELRQWLAEFEGAPVEERNRAIIQNKALAERLFGHLATNGSVMTNVLAAENQGDYDKGRYTFLTILEPLRARLVREHDIKTAAEFMLVDAVVLSYYQYLRAATALHSYIGCGESLDYETLARYVQTYLIRANELFLRNLEALRQMKAAPFVVKITQAGQVNVGEQQINLAGNADPGAGEVTLDGANGGWDRPPISELGPAPLPDPTGDS